MKENWSDKKAYLSLYFHRHFLALSTVALQILKWFLWPQHFVAVMEELENIKVKSKDNFHTQL